MEMRQAVACRVRELCAQRGITIHQLAKLAGIPASTVYGIANGKSKDPRVTTILSLCRPLHVTSADFFRSPLFEKVE